MKTSPRVLVACEYSARVRDAFRDAGADAWSCDLLPCEGDPRWHIQGDVLPHLDRGWDLMICHPTCTFLTTSGARWFHHPDDAHLPVTSRRPHPLYPHRREHQEESLTFVRRLLDAPIPRIALENPVGVISSRIRKPDQIIQPHWFNEDASKGTCLWLKGLPKLRPTRHFPPRVLANGAKRWSNQVDASGANKLTPSPNRWKERSRTFLGVAEAMADQWSPLLFAPCLA